jgi:hypothetical protein
VYALLFAQSGLSTAQITSLLIIWSVVPVVLEVPSGAVADLIPRRILLVGAALIRGIGFGLWVAAPGYLSFAIGFVLWGGGSALESGTYESYVYDHMVAAGAVGRYRAVISSGRSGGLVLNLLATLLAAPLLSTWGFGAVGAVSVAACAAQALIAATLPVDRRIARTGGIAEPTENGPAEVEDVVGGWFATVRAGLAEATRVRVVRRAMVLAVLLPAFGVLDEYFGLLARDMHTSLDAVPLLVSFTVAAQAIGAFAARRFPARRVGAAVVASAVLIGAGALAGVPAGFLAVAVGYGLFEMAVMVVETQLQDAITGPARATVTSVAGMLLDGLTIAMLGAIALGSAVLPVIGIVIALAIGMLPMAWLAARWTGAEQSQPAAVQLDSRQ